MMKRFTNKYQSRRSAGAGGFTLMEIMVALALISIAVVVAVQLFSANLRAIHASDGYVRAAANAGSVMRAILTDEDFPANASTAGTIDIYRYESTATKIEDEKYANISADMYRVDVVVRWREGERDKTMTISTMKLAEKKI
jgi:general secretion pathway protein I